ncbi:hypothetical protein GC173_08490 [bacterium]|nr:hypothetical protein [bacterium]
MGRLWGLLREWRTNPLVVYYDPRRRNMAGLAFRLTEGFGIVGLVFLVMSFALESRGAFGQPDVTSLLMMVPLSLALVVVLLFVAPGPWTKERSIDLRLTGVSGPEVAFGFLFWPAISLVIAGLGSGMLLAAIEVDFYRWDLLSTWLEVAELMATGMLVCLCLGGFTLEYWFKNSAWRWVALVLAPLKFLSGFVLLNAIRMVTEKWLSDGQVRLLVLVLLALWAASRLHLALTAAGWRILGAGCAGEELLRHHWRTRERTFTKLPGRGWPERGRFLRASLLSVTTFTVVLCLLTFMAAGLGYRLATVGLENTEYPYPTPTISQRTLFLAIEFAMLTIPLAACVAAWIASLWNRGRIPALSGGALVSNLVHTLPTTLILGCAVAFIVLPLSHDPFNDIWPWVTLTGFIAAIYFLLALSIQLLAPLRGRLLVSAVLCLASFGAVHKLGDFSQAFYAPSDAEILLLIFVAVALLFIEWTHLRVHRLELADVPLGRMNIDPKTDEPIASEALLDELAAKG